ncbi:MAG: glycosyltransferase family 87 protein [Pseudomonadota bacterium]
MSPVGEGRAPFGAPITALAAYGTRRRLLIIGLLLVPVTILLEVAGIWSNPEFFGRFPLGHDFVAFWAAARLFAEGGATLLYDMAEYSALQAEVSVREGLLLWHYPPHYLTLVAPLAGLSFAGGFIAFTTVNLLALVSVGRRLIPFPTRVGWAALLGAPVIAAAVVQGQNGAFFAACLVGGFIARERGSPWLAAGLFALILAKPQYGVLIPVVLLAQRDWAGMLRTGLACLVFTGLATAHLGTEIWGHFAGNTRMLAYSLTEAGLLAQMPTVWAALSLAGFSPQLAMFLHVALALTAIGTVWRLWRQPGVSPDLALAAALFGTLMISPYGFRYDMVLTLGGTLLLMRFARTHGWSPVEKLVLALMWLLPAVFPLLAEVSGAQIGPLISLSGLVLCTGWSRRCIASDTQDVSASNRE